MAAKVYAVRVGTVPGLYTSWPECEAQVSGFPGAEFKSFKREADAHAWLGSAGTGETPSPDGHPAPTPASPPPPEATPAPDPSGTLKADASGDLPPWDLPPGDMMDGDPLPAADPTLAPPTTTPAPAPPPELAPDYRQQLGDKARALLAYLQNEGVSAYATSISSPYHERIGIENAGFLDLYHTKKRPFVLRAETVLDPDLRERVVRLWRALHYGGAVAPFPRSPWDAVEHYHALLAPYADLRFDFVALARALRNAAPDAPDPDAVRFDFARINAAYHELRPQTP